MLPNLDVRDAEKQGNPLTGVSCRGMIEVMYKTPLIVLMPLLILGGTINAAEQAKPPRPAVKPPPSACTLVTKAEVQEAIGTAVSAGVLLPDPNIRMDACAFKSPKGEVVSIFLSRSADKRDLSQLVDQAKKAVPDASVREVPGLGEKAILVDLSSGESLLSVYRAGDSFVVSISKTGDRAKQDAAAEKIARRAFKRF